MELVTVAHVGTKVQRPIADSAARTACFGLFLILPTGPTGLCKLMIINAHCEKSTLQRHHMPKELQSKSSILIIGSRADMSGLN